MAVSKRLRYEVLRRDNHACRYCGGTAPDVVLTVDHVVPTALGGSDEPGNLVAACRDCNSGKSATPPGAALVADVAADALRWSVALRVAATALEAEGARRQSDRDAFDAAWTGWKYGGDWDPKELPRPTDWAASVDRWLDGGLTLPLLTECIRIAMQGPARPDDTWRYFCGVTYRRLAQLQDATRQVLASDGGEA